MNWQHHRSQALRHTDSDLWSDSTAARIHTGWGDESCPKWNRVWWCDTSSCYMGWHAVDDLWAVFFGAVWCFWTTERKPGMEGTAAFLPILPAGAFQTDMRVQKRVCPVLLSTVTPSTHALLMHLHWGPSLQTISLQSTKPLCVFWWCAVVHCRVPVLAVPC